MDEKLAKKLNRQLRAIKAALAFLTLLVIGLLVIMGFIAWTVVGFTKDVNQKVDAIRDQTGQSQDMKQQLCNDDSLTSLLQHSSVCNN